MTVRDYLYLSWLSYIDLPGLYVSLIEKGGEVPVAAFADCILRMDRAGSLKCVRLNDAARRAADIMKNSSCVITDYINNNSSDGFVAYVIKCGVETIVAMRGSESGQECGRGYIDWADNICEPFYGSVQLSSIKKLIESLPRDAKVTFTGHSKGGHNALLALSVSNNPGFRAVSFNGQGFSDDSLTDEEKERLAQRGINYVVASDIVGALLYHPERRIFVRQAPQTNAHMPEAFLFNENGEPIIARRTAVSFAAGAAARLADRALKGDPQKKAADLCRFVLERR